MRKLKELNLYKDNIYGLHLDFSDTKQKELFEDFIFTFLIKKNIQVMKIFSVMKIM